MISEPSSAELRISDESISDPKSSSSDLFDPLWDNLKEDYDIKEFIGKGTFGEVVEGIHKDTKTTVAIKLMKNVFTTEYTSK